LEDSDLYKNRCPSDLDSCSGTPGQTYTVTVDADNAAGGHSLTVNFPDDPGRASATCTGTCAISVECGQRVEVVASDSGVATPVNWNLCRGQDIEQCAVVATHDMTVTADFASTCGDSVCQAGENYTCATDCQTERAACGDGTCQATLQEDAHTCPADCN
ncbi:MAG: hypothetical protein AAGC55_17985, partial [Myxococcota bacterium]